MLNCFAMALGSLAVTGQILSEASRPWTFQRPVRIYVILFQLFLAERVAHLDGPAEPLEALPDLFAPGSGWRFEGRAPTRRPRSMTAARMPGGFPPGLLSTSRWPCASSSVWSRSMSSCGSTSAAGIPGRRPMALN